MNAFEKYAAKRLLVSKLAAAVSSSGGYRGQSMTTQDAAKRITVGRRQNRIAAGLKGGTNMSSRTSQPYTQSLASGVKSPENISTRAWPIRK